MLNPTCRKESKNNSVKRVLEELAEFGRHNDAQQTDRARRMLNITPETGQFLSILVRAMQARRVPGASHRGGGRGPATRRSVCRG